MEEEKEHAMIRCHAECGVSDQNLGFLSHMSICGKHFSRSQHNLKIVYEYKHVKKTDQGKHFSPP